VKDIVRKVKIFIFMAVLLLPGMIWYGVELFFPETSARWNFDLKENRAMAEMPSSILEEDYTKKLEDYYNDNIPFRSQLITWEHKLSGALEGPYADHIQGVLADILYGKGEDTKMDISGLLASEPEAEEAFAPVLEEGIIEKDGHRYKEEIVAEATCREEGQARYSCIDCEDSYTEAIPVGPHEKKFVYAQEPSYTSYGYTEYECENCGRIFREDFQGKDIDNSYLAPTIIGNGVLVGRFGWLFYTGDDSLAYYEGTNILEEEEMKEYLAAMQELQDICDEKGIRLEFMILPNKEQIYPEYMPSCEIADSYKRIGRLVDYIHENSDIGVIYPIRELKEAELYWQTYYQYDTHWNHVGAFIGMQALYAALDAETTDLRDVEVERAPAGVRELIPMGGLNDSEYEPDDDYVISYKPQISILSSEGDMYTAWAYHADSDSPNEQKFVLLGDSFRCFMTDYLVRDFSDCTVAHRDYAEDVSDYIRNADILVIEAVERYDAQIVPAVEKVIRILSEDIS